MWTKDMGIRALSIDGGGIKALSQLIMLGDLMLRLSTNEEILLVCDFFEVIGGTGAGAVIAVLLGRLGLTVEEAIKEFMDFVIMVFSEDDDAEPDPASRSSKLEEAIKRTLARHGLSPDTRLNDPNNTNGKCKVFVCAVSTANFDSPQLFRSYDSRVSYMDCTIVEALSASMASPSMFEPVSIGPPGFEQTFIGGSYTCNNPTRELMKEAMFIFGEHQRIACLLNLGSGMSQTLSLDDENQGSDEIAAVLEGIASDGKMMAEELSNQLNETGVYIRLSVDRGLETIGSRSWTELGNIELHTRVYLQGTHVRQTMEKLSAMIKNPTGSVTLVQLTRSTHSVARFVGLPPLTPHFVMRPQIWEAMVKALVDAPLDEPEEIQRIMVISGMCGCGKTQIAIRFAKDHQSHFSHVFLFDASSEATLRGDMQASIRSQGFLEHTAEDALSIFAEDEDFVDWLFIYDNANGVNFDIRKFLPQCQHGSVIITTQNRDLAQLSTAGYEHLGSMTDEEATETILRAARRPTVSPNEEDVNIAMAIARELGNLPLALVRAGSYAFQKRCFRNYLSIYRRNPMKLLEAPPSEDDHYHQSVHSTIARSCDALVHNAKELLNVLSFFHYSGIPREVFTVAAANDFSFQEERLDIPRLHSKTQITEDLRSLLCSDGEWNELQLMDTIHALQTFSLISVIHSPHGTTLSLHCLVSSWSRGHLREAEAVKYRAMAAQILTCGTKSDATKLQDRLIPHILNITSDGDLHPMDSVIFANVLAGVGRIEEAIGLQRLVVEACRTWNGSRHSGTIIATTCLADILRKQNLWVEALELQLEMLDLRKELFGEDHPEAHSAAVELSNNLNQMGRLKEADSMQQQVQKIQRKMVESVNTTGPAPEYQLRSMAQRGKGAEAKALAIKMMKGSQIAGYSRVGLSLPN